MTDNINPKFPSVTRPRWEPNQDINKIEGIIDFIKDEYGNYYTPYERKYNGKKLFEVTLVHVLYDEAFNTIFMMDEIEEYKYSHLGELLLDRMNGHIKELEIEGRKIFTLQELIKMILKLNFGI